MANVRAEPWPSMDRQPSIAVASHQRCAVTQHALQRNDTTSCSSQSPAGGVRTLSYIRENDDSLSATSKAAAERKSVEVRISIRVEVDQVCSGHAHVTGVCKCIVHLHESIIVKNDELDWHLSHPRSYIYMRRFPSAHYADYL